MPPLTRLLLLPNPVCLPAACRTEADFLSLTFKILHELGDVSLYSCAFLWTSLPTLITFQFS